MISAKTFAAVDVLTKLTTQSEDFDSIWSLFLDHNDLFMTSLQVIIDADAIDLLHSALYGLWMGTDNEETENHITAVVGLYEGLVKDIVTNYNQDVSEWFVTKFSDDDDKVEDEMTPDQQHLEKCLTLQS